jgi:hypothetical protein
LRINNSSSMIMQGKVPSSMNNIWAKKQTASERNELLLARNNKGITRKAFWYRNDVSIKLRINKSKCCRTHQVLVITMKSKGNNNKPVLKVVTTKTLQPPKRYHSADVCLPAVTRPCHNSFGPRKLFVYP